MAIPPLRDHKKLTEKLGYYSDVQSLSSEDTVTWSVFGSADREGWLNDMVTEVITYTYDQLNRLTQKSYPDTSTVNYTYDLDSRLTQVTDPTGTYQFTFDNMGRPTSAGASYFFLTARSFTTG